MSTAFSTIERGVTEDGNLVGTGCVSLLASPKHASFTEGNEEKQRLASQFGLDGFVASFVLPCF
jgi:hypothetical protein